LKIGLLLLGAAAGFTLAMYILAWKQGLLIENEIGRIIFIVAFALIGSILIQFIEKPLIIISTSILGSYLFFIGLDVFLKVGFVAMLQAFLNGNISVSPDLVESDPKLYAVLASVPVLAMIGVFSQFAMSD
jgi:hypothetical protein